MGWRYPDLQRLLDARQLPSLLLFEDVLDPSGRASCETATKTFVRQLESRGSTALGLNLT
jgi:hypothetical protein